MKLKLKLPSRSLTAGRIPGRELNAIVRKLRRYGLYGSGFFLVFLLFAWVNLPTKALAWRISHEARKQGVMLTVDDLSVSPFGSVTLEGIQWSFKPGHPDQAPIPFVMEELEVDVSLLSLLIGNLDIDIEGTMDEGTLSGNFTRGGDEGQVSLSIEDLPLYSVQHHPEASPGPHDAHYLFAEFIAMMTPRRAAEDCAAAAPVPPAETHRPAAPVPPAAAGGGAR